MSLNQAQFPGHEVLLAPDMQGPGQGCTRDYNRYVSSIKNPPSYGLPYKDFDRDHTPTCWPPGTEYQYAYCSNYRDLLPRAVLAARQNAQQLPPLPQPGPATSHVCWREGQIIKYPKQEDGKGSPSAFRLQDPTPLPLLDKHIRGEVYRPGEPLGVMVKEETKAQLKTGAQVAHEVDQVYTPNYRYRDSVGQNPLKQHQEQQTNTLYCGMPEVPTKYWDFYNVVRMGRDPKPIKGLGKYQTCRVLPLPIDYNIPNVPPLESLPELGKFNNYLIEETVFQPGSYANKLNEMKTSC